MFQDGGEASAQEYLLDICFPLKCAGASRGSLWDVTRASIDRWKWKEVMWLRESERVLNAQNKKCKEEMKNKRVLVVMKKNQILYVMKQEEVGSLLASPTSRPPNLCKVKASVHRSNGKEISV
jgi:hypothetical protein